MEEKQLNFNQPLLSVRRFSSKVASETDNKRKASDNSFARLPPLPPYKSEIKSGPVRNVGAIPFVWEKTPGRPKDESKLQAHAIENHPITPNLPPGRVSKTKQQDSDIVLKGVSENTVSNPQSVETLVEKVTKHEGSKEGIEEKESSDSDDDGDETFLDALDTLSRTESFFTSCSMSGWDDQEVSSDQQARDSEFDVKCIDQECTLASSKVEDDGKIDLESQCVMKLGLQELSDATSFFEIPPVLPSLKAPSESWLKRTLPTISSRNISSRPNLAAKLETLVKSSNVHHGHLHEELLNPIAED